MRAALIDFLETLNADLDGQFLHINISKYVDKILKFATINHICEDGIIKAFIAFYENDEYKEIGYLTMIAVAKDYWHLGYGKTLLESSVNQLKAKKFKRYRLQVKADNLKAIQLYENYGFVKIGDDKGLINMEKKL